MKSPLEDSIWGAKYGSVAAVQSAFDRLGTRYHEAIMASGAPAGAATALLPHLRAGGIGVDFGCGSGALGIALRSAGLQVELDGVDLSRVMLDLALASGCYRDLAQANVLDPDYAPPRAFYDFAISMGLVGDYVPYYVGLPLLAGSVRVGGIVAYAVESRSTPSRALEQQARNLGLVAVSETVLSVPEGALTAQDYHFFVTRRERE
jgi:2-polyprenyl-3-methyl-5-hydroxy-6-metoxy-1,4-benzoquinol methylase